jgi:two-component system cell cycle response regulator DivK
MSKSLLEATIVIVEDDVNSSLATKELLKLEGATKVHCFEGGDQAMDFLEKSGPVDLFLVDVHMPGETGYDFIGRVRSHPRGVKAKVIALTAGVLVDDVRRARAAGFDGFIGKPLKPAYFCQQVEQILAGEAIWEWR